MPVIQRRVITVLFLACAFLARPALAVDTTLGTGQYRLIGASFDVAPVTQSVPIGVAATVKTLFSGPVDGLSAGGARVAAELTGPGVPGVVTLTTAPGGDFVLPALSLKGEYRLTSIRLVEGGRTIFNALHPIATINVTDVLISNITSRTLTSQELASRGIVINDKDFKAYSFAFGLAFQGKTIQVEIPTVIKSRENYTPIGSPRVTIDNPDERFVPPTILAVPLDPIGDLPKPPDPDLFEEEKVTPQPVFGILIFPGNIRYLNQFFSVVLMVQNGSAPGSGLSLRDVTTTIAVPSTSMRVVKTTPSVPDGQPVPVRNPGPDGILGTADDLTILAAQQSGDSEFVTEGLRIGTHEVVCEIDARLDGVAGQPNLHLHGRARGSVLVRDPSFALTFMHPEVIRKDEEYELGVSVLNTSTINANQVSIGIDGNSLTGAVLLDPSPSAFVGDLVPGGSKTVKFHFRATQTGKVVASSFTSDGAVSGALLLKTAVTVDGTPLSPDSFIFPRFLASLPPGVADPATALIGIAHGLASADPAGSGNDAVPPFADGVVRERVVDLVEAARRASLGEPLPAAVADLAFSWLGAAAETPAFDAVRRRNARGRELETGLAAVLTDHFRTVSPGTFEQTLLDAAVASSAKFDPSKPFAGPVFVFLQSSDPAQPPARLTLVDQQTAEASSGIVGEAGTKRDLPFSAILKIDASSGGELGLVGRVGPLGINVMVEGKKIGSVSLDVFYPDGSGGYRSVRFDRIDTQAGLVSRLLLVPNATQQTLSPTATQVRLTVAAVAAAPSPFAALVAVQDLDASPLGSAATLLFNRRVGAGAGESSRYRLPAPDPGGANRERGVNGVFVQSDPRRVVIGADSVLSPFRPGFVEGAEIRSESGELWSGRLPLVPRLTAAGGSVEGRVLGPDGTPLPNAQVRLTESATSDLTGELFGASTSVTKTNSVGSFYFDYVRKQDGRPFRLDSFDSTTSSTGYAVGSIRTAGETLHVDVALQGRGTVKGTVVDASGNRLAGVIVRCGSTNDFNFRLAQFSAADGSFSFASVPVGSVQLQAEDTATNRIAFGTAFLAAPGATTSAQLVLAFLPRTSLKVTVLHGASGTTPFPNIYVAGYGLVEGQQDEYFGFRLAGAGGSVNFASAPAGNVRLELFDQRGAILRQVVTLYRDQPAEITVVVPESLPKFGSIRGIVRRSLDSVLSVVAGAVVYVDSSGQRTTTGNDGSYRLDDVPVGNAGLHALLPATGRTTAGAAAVQENLVSTLDLLFVDSTLGTVRGTVVDQFGQPRSGAKVEIWEPGPPIRKIAFGTSAADGSFLLNGVPVGTSRVQATFVETRGAITLRNAGAAQATIPGPGASATVSIPLRGFVNVSGRVVARIRDKDGILRDNPVYGPVELSSARFNGADPLDPNPDPDNPEGGVIFGDGPAFYSRVQTDPTTGAFSFSNVHGGRIVVTAKNPFYGDKSFDFGSVNGDTSRGPVDLVYDGTLGFVDGFLYNVDGTAIANGHLLLSGTSFTNPLEATSGPDGHFVFPLVPFADTVHVVFREAVAGIERYADAYASVRPASPFARVTLRTLPVGTVAVQVVSVSGNGTAPVSGAAVRIDELSGARRFFAGTTDGAGFVSFQNVTGGPIAVTAKKDLLAGRLSLLGLGEGFRAEGIVKLTGTARVNGTVKSPANGSGVSGVNVVLLSLGGGGLDPGSIAAATTGADGSFSFIDVPAPSGAGFRVQAEDPRTLRQASSSAFSLVVQETRVVDVTLRAVGSVAGTLTTFDGTRPLGGVDVTIVSFDSAFAPSRDLHVTTAPDGTYRADGILAGFIRVAARDSVTGLQANGSATLTNEGETVLIDLHATPTGRIQGSVLKADGSPLPAGGVPPQVTLLPVQFGDFSQTQFAATYDFDGVNAATVFELRANERVEPFHAGYLRDQALPGGTKRVDIRYGAFGTVRVHARKPDPANAGAFLPVQGSVRLVSGEGPYGYRFPSGATLRLDSSGDATFVNVGGGFGVFVSVQEDGTGNGGRATASEFTADGQTVDTTVVVETRGLVRGRFLQPAPNGSLPASGVEAKVYISGYVGDPRGPIGSVITGADGRFEIRDVLLRDIVVLGQLSSPVASAIASGTLSASAPLLDLGDLVLDGVRPRVVSSDPPNGASGLGLLPVFRFTFSEPLASLPSGAVRISGPFGDAGATTTLDATGTLVTVTPNSALAGATSYDMRLSGAITDRALLSMGGDFVIRFTTANLTAPTVLSSTPLPEQIQVRVDLNPTVVFTKALAPASLAAGVHVNRLDAPAGALSIAPALQADGKTVVLNPAAPLSIEAEYEILLDAVRDTAGNTLPAPVRIRFFTRDDRAPGVALDAADTTTPVEGTRHTYTLRWSDDDVKSITLYFVAPTGAFRYDGDTRLPARGDRSANFTLDLPRLAAAGGAPLSVHAYATDFGGNVAVPVDLPLQLQPDRIPVVASAAIEGPATLQVGQSFTVRVEATDDVGIVAIDASIPASVQETGVSVVNASPLDRVERRTYLVKTSAAPGPATLAFGARDTFGQQAAPTNVPFTITADAGPSIAIASPSGGSFVSGVAIPVTFTSSDDLGVARVTLTLGSSTVTISNPTATATATLVAPAVASSQIIALTAVATDTTGHTATASVSLTIVPNQPPTISILAPAPNASVLSGSALLVQTASSDDIKVTDIVLTLGSSSVTLRNPASPATATLTVPSVSTPQTLNLTATAHDGSGLATSVSIPLSVQPDAPPTLTVASPSDGTHVFSGSTLLVKGTLSDDNNQATVTATLGSVTRSAGVGAFTLSFAVPVVSSPAPMTLNVTAVDANGHAATPVSISLVMDPDTVAPTVSIGSPAQNESVVGGKSFLLVATASDNAGVTLFRYRINSGAFTTVGGTSLSVQIPTTAVSVETPLTVTVEAQDGAGNSTPASRSVRVQPNLPPTLSVTQPTSGARITASTSFIVSGTSTDDAGTPTVTALFNGVTKTITGTTFSFSFTAPAVSTPTGFSLVVSALDTEGNAAPSQTIPLTIVPDAGGTPTVTLTAPDPGVLVAGETTSLSITFADNVGLYSGSAQLTGGFTSNGLQSYPSLTGTSQAKSVTITSAEAPFGVAATVTATVTDLSARNASLSASLPVAYHRLNAPLPAGPYLEGSLIPATFKISASGRLRAASLRFEIGTLSGSTFTVLSCAQKTAPLNDLESLSVAVPNGRTNLFIRSTLVEATGAIAVGAKSDALSLFQDAIATQADAAAPVATFSAPAANASFVSGSLVPVTVTATDDVRVASIQVTLNGITKSCLSSPCSVSFFSPGVTTATPLTITAVAKDPAGKSGSASVVINVTPSGPVTALEPKRRGDGKPPRLRFVTPHRSPEAVPENADFIPMAEASDADGIRSLEFFLDDSEKACATHESEAGVREPRGGCFVPHGADGTLHRLRARATDRSGDVSEAEATLVVRDGLRITAPTTLRTGDPVYEGRRLFVESDLFVDGPFHFRELLVRAGATVAPARDGRMPERLELHAEGDIVADAGSLLTAGLPGEVAGAPGTPGALVLHASRIVFGGLFEAFGVESGEGGSIHLEAGAGIFGPVDSRRARFGLMTARGAGRISLEAPVVEIPLFDVSGGDGSGSLFYRDTQNPQGVSLSRSSVQVRENP